MKIYFLLTVMSAIIFIGTAQNAFGQVVFSCQTDATKAAGRADLRKRCGVINASGVLVECGGETVCTSNEFNTCTTRVCLVGVGGTCVDDTVCEGGSVCNILPGQTQGHCDISPDDDTASSSDLRDTIRRILNVILGFLGIITVVMVIYGGFVWLTAAGNDDNVAKGRHTLLWAALGAILIGIAWTVSSYILSVAEKVG